MNFTYLTTKELSERIHYNERTIRNQLKDSVLLEGVHYIRPFGGRKIFVWERIEEDMTKPRSALFIAYNYNRSSTTWPQSVQDTASLQLIFGT